MAARKTASPDALARMGAACAALGGGLRLVASVIPSAPDTPWLEAFYAAIDLRLLFGLIGVYLHAAEDLGLVGLAFFAISLAALASIVGPDATMFGVDFYLLGSLVLIIGLAGLSVQMLRRRILAPVALLWLASAITGLGSAVLHSGAGLLVAGAALGAGFLLAGALIHRERGGAPIETAG